MAKARVKEHVGIIPIQATPKEVRKKVLDSLTLLAKADAVILGYSLKYAYEPKPKAARAPATRTRKPKAVAQTMINTAATA